ncbi:unnamed protein product [Closterium sp. NIES-53]
MSVSEFAFHTQRRYNNNHRQNKYQVQQPVPPFCHLCKTSGTADSDGIVTFTSSTHPPDLDPDFSPEGFWYSHTIPETERTRALATIQHSSAAKTTSTAAETTSTAAKTTSTAAKTTSTAAEITSAAAETTAEVAAPSTPIAASTPTPTCTVVHQDIELAKTSGTHEWDI